MSFENRPQFRKTDHQKEVIRFIDRVVKPLDVVVGALEFVGLASRGEPARGVVLDGTSDLRSGLTYRDMGPRDAHHMRTIVERSSGLFEES